MIRIVCLVGILALGLGPASADEYWIAYEGNDFPENEGWTRVYGDENGHGQGGAERWIEDGALVIDSRRHIAIYDYNVMERQVDPGPAELFIMRWRLRIDEAGPREDPVVAAFSDDSWGVGSHFGESYLESAFETDVAASFEPGVFHAFEFHSWDMRHYELRIDGQLAITGQFCDVITVSEVGWGDGGQGSTSLSRWDYFHFGVVPEPRTLLMFVGAMLVAVPLRR